MALFFICFVSFCMPVVYNVFSTIQLGSVAVCVVYGRNFKLPLKIDQIQPPPLNARLTNFVRPPQGLLDYDADSDEEWEEEEPGESVSDSEGEGGGEEVEGGAEEGEDEDGFLVPHGYLSEGEGDQSEGEEEGEANVSEVVYTYSHTCWFLNWRLKPSLCQD